MKHVFDDVCCVGQQWCRVRLAPYGLLFFFLWSSLWLMAGCTAVSAISPSPTAVPPTQTPAPTPIPPERIAAGLAVYKELYCGVCHTLKAAESAGTFGPPHDGLGTTAVQRIQDPGYTGTAVTAAGYIRESIIDPQIYLVPDYALTPHQMPIFNYLEDEQIDALVLMLLAQ